MKRNDEFQEITKFVKSMYFYERRDFEVLRAMWTTYCIHWNLQIDTADYDNDVMCLFNLVRATALQAKEQMLDAEKLKRLYFKSFDNFMGKYMA